MIISLRRLWSPRLATAGLELRRETYSTQRRGRARRHRNPRVARLARLCAPERRAGQSRPAAARADDPRPPERRQAAVHRQHALHQHDSGRRAGRRCPAAGHRAPHQEPRPLERAGDGRARQQGRRRASAATSRPTRRRRRSTRSASTTSSAARTTSGDGDIVFFQGHAAPGIYARAFLEGRIDEKQLENFRRELARGRRPLVVSASLADAGLLGIPDRLDGPRPDHGDLPGALHPLPRGSRAEAEVGREGLGVSRRRRDRRAGSRSARSRCRRARSSTT